MKATGMETNIHEEEQDSPYLKSAKCLGTPKEAKYEEYQSKIENQASPYEFQNILLEPGLSFLSVSSLLDHNETSLQIGMAAGHVSATNQSETKHLCEELSCSARHMPKEDPLNLPLYVGKNSDKKPERSHEIRVIKHKPSAITFSDFQFLSHEANTKLHICEAGEVNDFSSEEEEADGRGDDDMFRELPLYETFFNGLHRRNVSQRKRGKHELTKYQHICHLEDCDDHSEKALKDHNKEEKHMELEAQPEKESKWADSMSWLMKKLEQLNLDIEEALSGASSPSSTPSSKRHKQLYPVQVETGFYGDNHEKGSWKNKRGDYQDLDCLPYPVSTGARPKTDGHPWAPWLTGDSEARLLLCGLLMLSGMFHRLKVGLVTFRPMELRNIYDCGTRKESSNSRRIACIWVKGNYLLCSLLLGNMLINITLTILLLHLIGSIIGAMVASTTGILLLGEITSHALCSQHGLAMDAKTIMVTKFFMLLMLPLSYPIGKLLDCLLGQEKLIWCNQEKLLKMLKVTEP